MVYTIPTLAMTTMIATGLAQTNKDAQERMDATDGDGGAG